MLATVRSEQSGKSMRIGVTMRVIENPTYAERRDAISHDCIQWLDRLGYCPVLIPNGLASPVVFIRELEIDGLVLTSGNDVLPRPNTLDETSAERDRTEYEIIRVASGRGLPILGICRGMHVLNLYFGGRVVADVAGRIANAGQHVAVEHLVKLDDVFGRVAGLPQITTNSFHNQAITIDGLGAGLKAFGQSARDGLVEGLVHMELPVLAVQWHPERPNPASVFDRAIVRRLFAERAFWK